jgi:hypothetical protein
MAVFSKDVSRQPTQYHRGLRKLEGNLLPTVLVVEQQFEELVRIKVPF